MAAPAMKGKPFGKKPDPKAAGKKPAGKAKPFGKKGK